MKYSVLGYLDDEADTELVKICDVPEESLGTVMAAAITTHVYCRFWCTSEIDDDEDDDADDDADGNDPQSVSASET